MKRLYGLMLVLAVGGAVPPAADARGPAAVREQVESTLLVKGTVDIAANGEVLGYALEKPDALPASVRDLIGNTVPSWQFAPIELDPGTTRGRASMSLRLVARQLGKDRYRVGISGAQFGRQFGDNQVKSRQMRPPTYPERAAYAGLGGTVYTVLKIDASGRVIEAVAEQVNLRAIAPEAAMEQWRDILEKATLTTARRWTFDVAPAALESYPFVSVRIPVEFVAPGSKPTREGEWDAYVPGPHRQIPWNPELSGAGADAIASGQVSRIDPNAPRLLSALDPG